MKGIILAGGKGTRLLPITEVLNKHLVSILNKPMILFPLETLKSLGVTDIMVVTGGDHIGAVAEFLGDGSHLGVHLTYRVQKEAGGIAQALGLAEDFCESSDKIAVVLGDNVFDNKSFNDIKMTGPNDAHLFVKRVPNPQQFGVLARVGEDSWFVYEKPKVDVGNLVVTGLYIYPPDVFEVIKTLTPSDRGEMEISDVNNYFLNKNRCNFTIIDEFWSDCGTPDSLYETINWVHNNGQ